MRSRLLTAPIVLLATTAAPAAAPFDDLLQSVPPTANILVMVDVKGLTSSPIGEKAGWTAKVEERFRSGVGVLPPGAERLLIAGQLNLAGGGWVWKAAVVHRPSIPPLKDIAAHEGGELDEVAGTPVVHSPRGAYFASLKADQLLVFHPPNRQALSQWIQNSK